MDALKALKEAKDKLKREKELARAKGAEIVGEKKFLTKGDLEAARIKRRLEEEEEERKQKEAKRKLQRGSTPEADVAAAKEAKEEELALPNLTREEVIRRLRALGHPSTLFGEEDYDRLKRLMKAEKEVHVEDETVGGQQENVLLDLQKQERERAKHAAARVKELVAASKGGASTGAAGSGGMAGASSGAGASTGATDGEVKKDGRAAQGPAVPAQPAAANGEDNGSKAEDATFEAFKRAAQALAEKREEEGMSIEDRIAKWIKRWVTEWQEDLEKRPESVKLSATGHQTTLTLGQSLKYFEPLYDRLKAKSLHEELRAGLWMIVQAMRDRNYLYANDIYLRLAIGNAPWPIGVTSVGIHERSAREKISHVMNAHGQAHIMNDEATRKYLQAIKRLISAVQRMYPTDPSRSANFETTADMGRGVAGGGSTKLALLQAEAKGETWQAMGLSHAPHFLEQDGKVMVPPKWSHILAKTKAEIGSGDEGSDRERSPAPGQAAS